jgi:hypothetical protein
MKNSTKIIGLISLISSLSLLTLFIPVEKKTNENLSLSVVKNCLVQIRELSSSNSLQVKSVFFDSSLISAYTLNNQMQGVKECSNSLNYESKNWQEAVYILSNMQEFQPVPDSVKRVLNQELHQILSLFNTLSLTPQQRNFNRFAENFFWISLLGLSLYLLIILRQFNPNELSSE